VKKIFINVLFFIVFTSSGSAEMITMVTCNWQPFQGEDLPKQGFTAEIARQALNRKGHTFKLIFRPWARAVDQVKKGNYVALFNPWKNKDNENDFLFFQ